MLEIVALIFMAKGLGNILRAKGRKPIGYQVLLFVSWFGAEVVGGLAIGIYQGLQGNVEFEFGLAQYLMVLGAAAASAGLIFLLAYLLPPVNQQAQGYSPYGASNVQNAPPSAKNTNPYAPPNVNDGTGNPQQFPPRKF